jgi:hypothetical protein
MNSIATVHSGLPTAGCAGMRLADADYAAKPLAQELSLGIPYGSDWVVEPYDPSGQFACMAFAGGMHAPRISCDAAGWDGGTLASPFPIIEDAIRKTISDFTLSSVGFPKSILALSNDALLRKYVDALIQGTVCAFWAAYGCGLAGLKITHWDQVTPSKRSDAADVSVMSAEQTRFSKVKSQLQEWFGVSVDELAALLDLSPTTIINLTKRGRGVHPKTLRKMMAVYGLLAELQKVVGRQTALTWARTVGYRLLSGGDFEQFEKYISNHIFPTVSRAPSGAATFGDSDVELVMKASAAVGRPSRL